jgi:cbb3-type cytochrome oxidase subunit 3
MFKDLFSSAALLDLPVVSMIAFIAVFAGVLVWVSAKRRRPHYDRMSQLPLQDD